MGASPSSDFFRGPTACNERLSWDAEILVRSAFGIRTVDDVTLDKFEARWKAIESGSLKQVIVGLQNQTAVPSVVLGTRIHVNHESSVISKRAFVLLGLAAHLHVIDSLSSPILVALTHGVLVHHCSDAVCFAILDRILSKQRQHAEGGRGAGSASPGEAREGREHVLGPLLYPSESPAHECALHDTLEGLLWRLLPQTTRALAQLEEEGAPGGGHQEAPKTDDASTPPKLPSDPSLSAPPLALYSAVVCSGLLLDVLPSERLRVLVAAEFLQRGWRALFLYGVGLVKLLKRGIKRKKEAETRPEPGVIQSHEGGAVVSSSAAAAATAHGAENVSVSEREGGGAGGAGGDGGAAAASGASALEDVGRRSGGVVSVRTQVLSRLKELVAEALAFLSSSAATAAAAAAAASTSRGRALDGEQLFFASLQRASCRTTRGRKGKWEGVPPLASLTALVLARTQQLLDCRLLSEVGAAPAASLRSSSSAAAVATATKGGTSTSGSADDGNSLRESGPPPPPPPPPPTGAAGAAVADAAAMVAARVCSWEELWTSFAPLTAPFVPGMDAATVGAGGSASLPAGAIYPLLFADATNALHERLAEGGGRTDEQHDSSSFSACVELPALLLRSVDDRCALSAWLPANLQNRRLELLFSTDRDGFHLPTLVHAGDKARATVLVVQSCPPQQTTAGRETVPWSSSSVSSSSVSSRVFGCVVCDASWGEAEQGSGMCGGVFEGGHDSFLFCLPPPSPPDPDGGDLGGRPATLLKSSDEGATTAPTSTTTTNTPALASGRCCFHRDPAAKSTAPVLNLNARFLGVGPADDGDGFGLMLNADLQLGSSVATSVFRNPPLHVAKPLASTWPPSDEGAGGDSSTSCSTHSEDADAFAVSAVELYALL